MKGTTETISIITIKQIYVKKICSMSKMNKISITNNSQSMGNTRLLNNNL